MVSSLGGISNHKIWIFFCSFKNSILVKNLEILLQKTVFRLQKEYFHFKNGISSVNFSQKSRIQAHQ